MHLLFFDWVECLLTNELFTPFFYTIELLFKSLSIIISAAFEELFIMVCFLVGDYDLIDIIPELLLIIVLFVFFYLFGDLDALGYPPFTIVE